MHEPSPANGTEGVPARASELHSSLFFLMDSLHDEECALAGQVRRLMRGKVPNANLDRTTLGAFGSQPWSSSPRFAGEPLTGVLARQVSLAVSIAADSLFAKGQDLASLLVEWAPRLGTSATPKPVLGRTQHGLVKRIALYPLWLFMPPSAGTARRGVESARLQAASAQR